MLAIVFVSVCVCHFDQGIVSTGYQLCCVSVGFFLAIFLLYLSSSTHLDKIPYTCMREHDIFICARHTMRKSSKQLAIVYCIPCDSDEVKRSETYREKKKRKTNDGAMKRFIRKHIIRNNNNKFVTLNLCNETIGFSFLTIQKRSARFRLPPILCTNVCVCDVAVVCL